MSAERAMTLTVNGGRQYQHPVTGQMVPSVTSVLDALAKDALVNWKVDVTAEYAVDNVEILARLDRAAAIDLVKRAQYRSSKTAAERGTDVHAILEDLARGVQVIRTPSNGWVLDAWEALNREFDIEVLEVEPTFWHPGIVTDEDGNPDLGYAGSADLVARINGVLAVLDWKTTASGIWPETCLQLCAYGMAPQIIRPTGEVVDFRETYGIVQETYAVWVRPDDTDSPKYVGPEGWALIPMHYTEKVWRAFRAARIAWEWQQVDSKGTVGKPINANPLRRGKARKSVA